MIITPEEIAALKLRHRTERDSRVSDRIKAIVLHSKGWSNESISEALLIHIDTVNNHIKTYKESKKLKPVSGGSNSLLSVEQTALLKQHLEENIYTKTAEICAYVSRTYGIDYTISGMTDWLHRNKFSYKQPKGVPAKADPLKQAEFIKKYEALQTSISANEPILFGDGVHPTMATKFSHGWMKVGVDTEIKTTASRTRVNLFGSLNLEDMSVITTTHETINSESMEKHFQELQLCYPMAPVIHLILDCGPYNISNYTKEAARKCHIKLHFLPTYSPNLNPIERVWKIMNEHVRNNKYFESAEEFREAIANFFSKTWDKISQSMVDRVNDNFQTITGN